MQVETEPSVEKAMQQISTIETEEEEDPLEGLNNRQITEIYEKLTPEDRQLFKQFKKFHKLHYELYGHDTPSYQLDCGIVEEIFPGIPAKDAEVVATAWTEILAAERLKGLCKKLELAVPTKIQQCQKVEAPEYPPPPLPLHFPSRQDMQRQAETTEDQYVKPDIKPLRRMATSYLGKPGLLCMVGTGDEDHIINKVLPGTDPLQEFDEDNPEDVITIDQEMDESDVDDLSEASVVSADAMTRGELQGLLANVAASQQKAAEAMDALIARVGEMTTNQVDQAAATIVTEMGHIRGLHEITQAFDKAEIGLILATGVRKLHEYQCLKGKCEEADIIPYSQLQKKFGANRRTIIECAQGYKYRYPKGVVTKVQFALSKPEPESEEEKQGAAAEAREPTK